MSTIFDVILSNEPVMGTRRRVPGRFVRSILSATIFGLVIGSIAAPACVQANSLEIRSNSIFGQIIGVSIIVSALKWLFQGPVVNIHPVAGSYNSNALAANTMFQMNLSDRLSSYQRSDTGPDQGSAWVRYSGARNHLRDGTGDMLTKGDKNAVMIGVDMLILSNSDRDQMTVGVMGGYGHYSGNTFSSHYTHSTTGKVNGYGVGLYGTVQQNVDTQQGFYADSWVLWNHFDNSVKGADLSAEKYDAKGMTASLELGYSINLAERGNVRYVLQPHTQAIYQNVRAESFRQANGMNVDFMNGSRVQTAVGMRAAAQIATGLTSVITPHIEANWLHSTKGYRVGLNDDTSYMNGGRDAAQLKVGIQGGLNRNVSLNLEVFRNQGINTYHETGGNLSAKYRF